jgi:hypothetical protein
MYYITIYNLYKSTRYYKMRYLEIYNKITKSINKNTII